MSGRLYVEVVQSILLFVSEVWMVTPYILRVMWSLRNWVARWISGRITHQLRNGGCYYPPIGEALSEAGLEMIGVYVTRC